MAGPIIFDHPFCIVHCDGVTTKGLEDVFLEPNAFPDRELNPGHFDLEPTVLTVIPPCFGLIKCCIMEI